MDTATDISAPLAENQPGTLACTALLMDLLGQIEACDQDGHENYDQRRNLILRAMMLADVLKMATGYNIDPNEPHWPVASIQLPTGQVSWHMPRFPWAYDGHSTPEKYARCRAFRTGRLDRLPLKE